MTGFIAVVDMDDLGETMKLRKDLEAAQASAKRKPDLPDLLYIRVPGVNRVTLPCRLRAMQTAASAQYLELLHPKTKRVKIDARMVASMEDILKQQRPAGGEVAIEVDREAARAKRDELRARGESAYLVDCLRLAPARRILARIGGPVFGWREPTADELRAWVRSDGLVDDAALQAAGVTVFRYLTATEGLEVALQRRDASTMLDMAVEQLAEGANRQVAGRPAYLQTIEAVHRRDRKLDTAGGTKVPTIIAQQLHTAPGRGGQQPDTKNPEKFAVTLATHELEEPYRGEKGLQLRPAVNHQTIAEAGGPGGALHQLWEAAKVQRGQQREPFLGIEARAELPQRTKRSAKRKPMEDPRQLVLWATEAEQVAARDIMVLDQRTKMPDQERWQTLTDVTQRMIAGYGVQTLVVGAAVFKLWRAELEAKRDTAGAIAVGVNDVARVLGMEPRSLNAKRRAALEDQLRLLTAIALPVKLGTFKGKEWTWHTRVFVVEEFLRADDGETIYRLRPTARWQDPKDFMWIPDELMQLDLGRQELEVRMGTLICREFGRGYGAKIVSERDLRRRLDWMLMEAGDISVEGMIRRDGPAAAKARLLTMIENLEAIGLDIAVEWNDENLLASVCRLMVSERLALVHHQLAGKRLLGVTKAVRPRAKPRKQEARAKS
jgi:hypothetical protein